MTILVFRRACLVVATVSLLASCGGGSEYDDPTKALDKMPPHAQPQFSGNRKPLVVDADSIDESLRLVALAVQTTRDFNASIATTVMSSAPVGDFNQTVEGSAGGSASIRGHLSRHDIGWVEIEYNDFDDGTGVVVDGRLLEEFVEETVSLDTKISYHGLRFVGPGGTVHLQGNITAKDPRVMNGKPMTVADFSIAAPGIDGTLWVNEFSIEDDEFLDFYNNRQYTRKLEGRVYHSDSGYIDVSTDESWLHEADRLPESGNSVEIEGEGRARVESLNHHFAGVSFDVDGNGSYEKGNRYNWSDVYLFASAPAATPLDDTVTAHAGIPQQIMGEPLVNLSALYSHAPGNTLLEYEWKLAFAPPGEQGTLHDANLPIARYEGGTPGMHVFTVTVSDGETERSDSVMIDYLPDGGEDPYRQAALGSIDSAGVGHTVYLDGRVNVNSPAYFELEKPIGSAALLAGSGETVSFVPDVAGVYVVKLIVSTDPEEVGYVYVDTPMQFESPVPLDNRSSDDLWALFVEDIDGDASDDFIVRTRSGYDGSLYATDGAGHVSTIEPLDFTSSAYAVDHDTLATGDFDHSGRRDLVAHSHTGIQVLRGDESAFADAETFPHSIPNCTGDDREKEGVAVGDVNGDDMDDIVSALACHGRIDVHLGLVGGGFAAPVPWDISAVSRLRVADLNNDGNDDLILSLPEVNALAGDAVVATAISNGDGTFQAPVIAVEGFGYSPWIEIADMNGDIYPDVIVSTGYKAFVVMPGALDPHATVEDIGPIGSEGPTRFFDVNLDGKQDLIFTREGYPGVTIRLRKAGGGWEEDFFLPGYYNYPAALDFDGDGLGDLVYLEGGQLMISRGR